MEDLDFYIFKLITKKYFEYTKDHYSKYAIIIPSFGGFISYLYKEVKEEEKKREEYSKTVEE